MADRQVRITFQPHGRGVFVLPGTKLLEAAARAGMTIETPCGGTGTCGKCRVQLTEGAPSPTDADRAVFSGAQIGDGWRLACQTAVGAETVVFVPSTSRFADEHQIFTEAQEGAAEEVLPAVRKVYVELTGPSLDDNAADLIRLEQAVGPLKADLPVLRKLPAALRKDGFRGTAVLTDHHLIDFEPGDTTARCFGVAADVGTTTLVASLMDLASGEELAIASGINPQVDFGDDVLSRIQRCNESPGSLEELRVAVAEAVGGLIGELAGQAGADRHDICRIAIAGNTTMEHLLCGIDVTQLGQVPFTPACGRGLVLPAADLGIRIHPRADAYVFPVIGGFVGGDTVAGILAAKLAEAPEPVLMVDIGTNGEIVVARDGELWAASTAAGPAFEGARISCGMRATAGAIEKVVFDDDDVRINVIGNAEPVGLCGSGLIDLAAELLTAGMLSPDGRLLGPDELPESLPEAIRSRAVADEQGHPAFLLAGDADADADGEKRITLTQRDVRELQLAAGAIRAGVKILLRQAGLTTGDLAHVLVAGGFGSFIRRSKAQRIGLLPTDVDRRRITYIGNASLNGAKWALLSTRAHKHAEQLARQTKHVQLSQDPDFQKEFAEAMFFPPGG